MCIQKVDIFNVKPWLLKKKILPKTFLTYSNKMFMQKEQLFMVHLYIVYHMHKQFSCFVYLQYVNKFADLTIQIIFVINIH